jgi:hypothetical protein
MYFHSLAPGHTYRLECPPYTRTVIRWVETTRELTCGHLPVVLPQGVIKNKLFIEIHIYPYVSLLHCADTRKGNNLYRWYTVGENRGISSTYTRYFVYVYILGVMTLDGSGNGRFG